MLSTTRLNQNLKTMLALQPREGRGRGTKYPALPILINKIELLAEFKTIRTHTTQVRSMNQQTREGHERRIRMVLPVAKLFLKEPFIVLRARVSQRIVIRMISLNQDAPRSITTSRTSCYLCNQLKGSLCRPKVR